MLVHPHCVLQYSTVQCTHGSRTWLSSMGVGRCSRLWGHNTEAAHEKFRPRPHCFQIMPIFALSRLYFAPGRGRKVFLGCRDREASSKISRAYLVATLTHKFTIARPNTALYWMVLTEGALPPLPAACGGKRPHCSLISYGYVLSYNMLFRRSRLFLLLYLGVR